MIEEYKKALDHRIEQMVTGKKPIALYDPIHYIMELGGKRLRPLLTLMAYSLFEKDWQSIINQSLAVEVFHNFTLMHDDIMDNAPLRRGKQTVHEKWNRDTAILSGDVMLVKAYELLTDTTPQLFQSIVKKFNQCAIEVCEGQQIDMNFESLSNVSEADYLEMIRLKTAVLLGFSLELGSLLAYANHNACQQLRSFGENIGIGFQLKDDLLDVYASQSKFGKQVGGDIIANKKTFLLIKALKLANSDQLAEINNWLCQSDFDPQEKVSAIMMIYDQLDIKAKTEAKMQEYFNKGFAALEKLDAQVENKKTLLAFAKNLITREQ